MATSTPLGGQFGIITGAGRGLGRTIGHRLAADGLELCLVDKDRHALASARAEFEEAGHRSITVVADVTDPAQVEKAVETAMAHAGNIDVLINACGMYPYVPFEKIKQTTIQRFFAVNVESAFLMSRAVIDSMKAQKYGRIVNFSSAVALNGYSGTAYASSKAAIMGFTRALALEIGGYGITVNSVAPGLIESPGIDELGPRAAALYELVMKDQVVKRRGTPVDIAEAVAYMVSPAAGFLMGQTIVVDGGSEFL